MALKQNVRAPKNPFATPNGPWQDRVAYAAQGLVAYRPSELLVSTDKDRELALGFLRELTGAEVNEAQIQGEHWLLEGTKEFDVERAILELREQGINVEANVVFFNHSTCGCGCCGDGFGSYPFNSNPFNSNPFNSNPFNSNPFNSNPFNSNPFNSNGWATNGVRASSARPAPDPGPRPPFKRGKGKAIVLDTGIAEVLQLPQLLAGKAEHIAADPADREEPDFDGDNLLDASSGHGTFIAGVIEQLAPNHSVTCARVLGNLGDGDAASIAKRLYELLPTMNKYTILNMSFGTYGDPELHLLSEAIKAVQDKGAVVVSSAGNDGTCLRSYPAALPDVVSVGSVDGSGRAYYSNYGSWVRACAPGTDVISSFYNAWNGDAPTIPGEGDPDDFRQWARWTGTSFAAPIVVAALIRYIAMNSINNATAADAVKAIIDAPALGRYPSLGTVVNLVPGM